MSLIARLEALLFAAPTSVTSTQLAAALEMTAREVEDGLQALREHYEKNNAFTGIRLQHHRGRYQLTTDPRAATLIEKFLGLEASSRLSHAALEALAIAAYKQPVTRPQIDAIRGVNSDGVLKSLLSKGLIQEVGRAEAPGRPILYSTTPEFLQYFGLNSLEQMPPLEIEKASSEDAQEDEGGSEILKD